MTAKPLLIATLFVVSACASNTALAQDDAAAQDRFTRMHEMAEAFDSADDPMRRRMLARDHMALMREQMAESGGMMTGSGMMHGGGSAPGEDVDMAAMREHMAVMHQMMTQMMAQQQMMMEMQEEDDGEY